MAQFFLALEPKSTSKTGNTSSLGTHQKFAMQIPRNIHQLYSHLYKWWTCCLPTDTYQYTVYTYAPMWTMDLAQFILPNL